MSRRPTSFRHQSRPPPASSAPRSSFTGSREQDQDKERRAAYLAVGLAATVAQLLLILAGRPDGRFPLGHLVGMLLALGLSLAIYQRWVPIRRINMLVAYGNTLWIGGSLLAVLTGLSHFAPVMFIINAMAVFIAMSWLPARQAIPFSAGLTGLLVLVVLRFAPAQREMLSWTIYLNILFVFMTYFGQRINDARTREEMLEKLASTDALTGVLNRRGGWQHLERLIRAEVGAVILADVDNFKVINDQNGHALGDEVLRAIALALGGPSGHAVARWGGEEFLILLPGVSQAEAGQVAEQVLENVRQLRFSRALAVTLSLGIADIQETSDPDQLIALADQRMYAAKQAGGNGWQAR